MKYIVSLNGNRYEVEIVEENGVATTPAAPVAAPVSGDGETVKSPLPGTVLSINVAVGDTVKAGDVVMVVEAMKMENEMLAPVNGVIKAIAVTKGAAVSTDDTLYILG